MVSNTTGLARLAAKAREIAEGLGRSWSVELLMPAEPRDPYPTLRPRTRPAGLQPTNADVALANPWLSEKTPTADDRVRAALADAWRRGIHNGGALMMVAAHAWKRVLVDRATNALVDVRAPSNSSAWAERKQRLGLTPAAGQASGQLALALEAATPVARKVA
jgi:hypothetical protein